jgi:hypothetical protein
VSRKEALGGRERSEEISVGEGLRKAAPLSPPAIDKRITRVADAVSRNGRAVI